MCVCVCVCVRGVVGCGGGVVVCGGGVVLCGGVWWGVEVVCVCVCVCLHSNGCFFLCMRDKNSMRKLVRREVLSITASFTPSTRPSRSEA